MYERAVALKLPIKTLMGGDYKKGKSEYDPHHILVNGHKVSRVNIIAEIDKKEDDFFLKDKTGEIKIISFDAPIEAKKGDVVRVIGKIREREEERFLSVEAIVEVDPKEKELRALELEKNPLEISPRPEEKKMTKGTKEPKKEKPKKKAAPKERESFSELDIEEIDI